MWAWLVRLWDYLRRLIVGDDEGLIPDDEERPPPTRSIGEELQDFFLELLKGTNLQRFQETADRDSYVAQYIQEYPDRHDGQPLSDHAIRLINSPDLLEIEQHISQIQSTPARLLYVVCPPM